MQVDVLLGLQWGDEGKGKIVDYLAPQYDIIARFQGGPNAGHTLIINGEKVVLHTIPSGIFHKDVVNVIGNGVVINPITLRKEIMALKKLGVDVKKNLLISEKAHLILPTHIELDKASESAKGANKIGSTLRGIGPTYMDKTGRNGVRAGFINSGRLQEEYDRLKAKHLNMLANFGIEPDPAAVEKEWMDSVNFLSKFKYVDTAYYLNNALAAGKKVLAEGAQGSMLDIDFGTYPFVTSSNTITAGACTGLGISPKQIGEVIGISKAYCTRVGSGPFPSEIEGEEGDFLRSAGGEFGATTGRPRRCGWLDLPSLKYAIMLNGVTQLAITKADVLNELSSFKICTAFDINGERTTELPFDFSVVEMEVVFEEVKGWKSEIAGGNFEDTPTELKDYIQYLEDATGVPVSMISTGPEREKLITKQVLADTL